MISSDRYAIYKQLLLASSIKDRLTLLIQLLLLDNEVDGVNDLIKQCNLELEKKKLQGSLGGKTKQRNRIMKEMGIPKSQSFKSPYFCVNYSGGDRCSICLQIIGQIPCFLWKRDGIYSAYHALPDCQPEGIFWEDCYQFRKWKNSALKGQ